MHAVCFFMCAFAFTNSNSYILGSIQFLNLVIVSELMGVNARPRHKLLFFRTLSALGIWLTGQMEGHKQDVDSCTGTLPVLRPKDLLWLFSRLKLSSQRSNLRFHSSHWPIHGQQITWTWASQDRSFKRFNLLLLWECIGDRLNCANKPKVWWGHRHQRMFYTSTVYTDVQICVCQQSMCVPCTPYSKKKAGEK